MVSIYEGIKRLDEEINRLGDMEDLMVKASLLPIDFIEEKGLKDEFEEWAKGKVNLQDFDKAFKELFEKKEPIRRSTG